MNEATIKAIVEEISPDLLGRMPGKLFQLSSQSLAIDFRLHGSRYLFVSVETANPRLHLIQRRTRDLEKQSLPPSPFALQLKKELSGTALESIKQDSTDRIVRFSFAGRDEAGAAKEFSLVAQLTGRSANLLLLDGNNIVVASLRSLRGGPAAGEKYEPPRGRGPTVKEGAWVRAGNFDSLSAALDAHYQQLAGEQIFEARAASLSAELQKELTRGKKLLKKLGDDLAGHAGAEDQKRLGDLLLANLSTAKRSGGRVKLIDYFAEETPTIELELDDHSTLPEEAARRFASYSRSKRAVEKINERIAGAEKDLSNLKSRLERLAVIVSARDEVALFEFTGRKLPATAGGFGSVPPAAAGGLRTRKPEKRIPGTRRYLSTDGYEILVGRAAHDNDHLTFKVAKPNDLWLHAADYPGSHVVVRNSTRKEIPQRTMIEAAQLAAYFSQARKDSKVSIHYTQRKFLAKPKGAASGLVRLLRFKTINVEPGEIGTK